MPNETTMPTKYLLSWGFDEKLTFGIHMAIYGTPIVYFIEKYIFNDWNFLISLFLMVMMDTLLGAIAAAKEGKFSSKEGVKGFGIKVGSLAATLVCIGIIDNATIAGKGSILEGVIDAGAFAIMMAFEGISVLKNIYRIKKFEVIVWLLQKLDVLTSIKKKDEES